jgi:formate dehydrogenase subunit gamma
MAGQTPWNADLARQRIRKLLHLDGALLPILHALQEEFGCIDEAAEPLIAAALNRSRAEIHGVVTFYHDFRRTPPGRHVLMPCGSLPGGRRRCPGRTRRGAARNRDGRDGGGRQPHARTDLLPRAVRDGAFVVGRLDQRRLDAVLAQAQR